MRIHQICADPSAAALQSAARVTALAFAASAVLAAPIAAQEKPNEEPSDVAVEQLRHAHGRWDVATTFFHPNGVDSMTVEGRYDFDWVVPDRALIGVSTIPIWDYASGILFFVRPSSEEVEMVTVSADGVLWRMIGADTSETRATTTRMPDGTDFMARFTRYGVTPDTFRSRMERSEDGGKTWDVTNRQLFVRAAGGGIRATGSGSPDLSATDERADAPTHRVLRKEILIAAERDAVWSVWTDADSLAFLSPESRIDARPGGEYDWFLDLPADEQGRRGSEGSRVLALVPGELIVFDWTFPRSVAELRSSGTKTQVVVSLDSTLAGTRVRLVQTGWGEGPAWEAGYTYFDSAWAGVLQSMKEHLEGRKES